MKPIYILLAAVLFLVDTTFGQSRNIGIAEVTVIEFGKNGDIWMGSYGQGVGFYRDSDQTIQYFRNNVTQLQSDYVTSIGLLPIGSIRYSFIGTEKGVSVATANNTSWSFLSNVANDSIRGVFVDSPSVWVLTAHNGASVYNVTVDSAAFLTSPATSHYQYSCVQHSSFGCDSIGFTAGTTNTGVVYTSEGTHYDTIDMAPPCQHLIDNRVNVVVWDDSCKNRIVGTQAGLSVCPVRTTNPSLPKDTCHNYMHGYNVTSITNGCDGKKWIGTATGLFTIDLSAQPPNLVQVLGIQQNQAIGAVSRDTGCNMLIALQSDSNLYFLDPTGGYIDILKISGVNGIGKVNVESFTVRIYPQPSSNQINFVTEKEIVNGRFLLVDITGRTLQQLSIGTTNRFTTDVSSLTNGIYFYQIYSGNNLLKTGKAEVLK